MYGIANGGGYISDTGIYRCVTVMGRLLCTAIDKTRSSIILHGRCTISLCLFISTFNQIYEWVINNYIYEVFSPPRPSAPIVSNSNVTHPRGCWHCFIFHFRIVFFYHVCVTYITVFKIQMMIQPEEYSYINVKTHVHTHPLNRKSYRCN